MEKILSRSRAYIEGWYKENDVQIVYYDYEHIDSSGNNMVHTFYLNRKVYDLIAEEISEEKRDDIVLKEEFCHSNGWNTMKAFLDQKGLEYRYEEKTFDAKERFEKQKSQFGERRCVHIHLLVNAMRLNELNDYEYNYALELIKNRDVIYEIPGGWEEDEYRFLIDDGKMKKEEALDQMMSLEEIAIRSAEDAPEEFRPYLKKWHEEGKKVTINWYSKYGEFGILYKDKRYRLYPEAMDLSDTEVDHICLMIENDLYELGCEVVNYYGMLD